MNSYSWSACTLPARSGGQLLELPAPLLGDVLDDLLAALVARAAWPRRPAGRCRRAPVDDLVELLGDVVVDAAEVAALELLAAGARAAARASRAGP